MSIIYMIEPFQFTTNGMLYQVKDNGQWREMGEGQIIEINQAADIIFQKSKSGEQIDKFVLLGPEVYTEGVKAQIQQKLATEYGENDIKIELKENCAAIFNEPREE